MRSGRLRLCRGRESSLRGSQLAIGTGGVEATYQAIAFATIYNTNNAAVIGFAKPGTESPSNITVGDMHLRHIDWQADPELSPEDAAASLASDVANWLASLEPELTAVAAPHSL